MDTLGPTILGVKRYLPHITSSSAGKCRFMLTSSLDGGQTWSPPKEIVTHDGIAHNFESPAMAANRDGIVGLMWRDRRNSDCWYFSVSLRPGEQFSPSRPLSQCLDSEFAGSALSTAFLVSEIAGDDVRVANMRGEVWRNSGSLTATADGAFHPVWAESGNGNGELRTAKVQVGASDEGQVLPVLLDPKNTHEINREVTLLYGGDQRYDSSSGTLTLDVVLRNTSSGPIKAPVFLRVLTLVGELGDVEIMNANNRALGPGAIWDVSRAIQNGVLPPGATTQPYLSLSVFVSMISILGRESRWLE